MCVLYLSCSLCVGDEIARMVVVVVVVGVRAPLSLLLVDAVPLSFWQV